MSVPPPFVVALAVASLLAGGLAVVGYRHRDATGAPAFVVMMAAVAVWSLGDAAQLSAVEMGPYRWWLTISFLAAVLSANAGLVFVVQYTGHDHWVTRRTLALLAVEPVAIALLVWTTPDHGLVWSFAGPLRTDPVSMVPIDYGIAFHLHLLYTYGLMAVLLWLLVRFYLRSRGTYRWQTLLLLVGGLLPIVTNVVWQVVQQQYPRNVDPTPLTFVLMGSLFTVGLRSFDLLELVPVGRHTIVEELQDAVLTVNNEERIVDANPVARQLLAGSDETLIGERARHVVPQYEAVLDRGGEADDVIITVEDERRYFDVRQTPLTDAAEEVVGRIVLLRDVTERRRVEKRYQLLIENASDIVTVLEADGTIRYAGPSTKRHLGYEPEKTQGSNALAFVHPDDRAEIADQITTLADDPGRELEATYRVRTADGEWRVIDSRGRNLLDDPVVEGIVVNSRDITDRREREQRLQQRNEQLEEFASVISHDLRNPLSVAHGYARLLQDEYDDERLGRIANAHDRMEELLEDLLTLAREGRAVSETEPVPLADAARQAWAIVDTTNATLDVDGHAELLADDTRLRQLLENLFANAVEHGSSTPTDSVASATPSADGGDQTSAVGVRVGTTDDGFYVADDGPGIPEADREHVFEAGESGQDEGIGLGLTIVRRIAEAHGWSVTVDESEEGGARFTFTGCEWVDEA